MRWSRLGLRVVVCLGETGACGSDGPSPVVLAFLGARPSCWWQSASPQHVDPAVRGLVGVGDDIFEESDAVGVVCTVGALVFLPEQSQRTWRPLSLRFWRHTSHCVGGLPLLRMG